MELPRDFDNGFLFHFVALQEVSVN